jgi:hypothetical protein
MVVRSAASAALLALASLLDARPVAAQLSSRLEAGGVVSTRDGALPNEAFRVRPGLQLFHPHGTVAASGSAWRLGDNWLIADGDLSVTMVTPARYGIHGELAGSASRVFYDPAATSEQFDARGRVYMSLEDRAGVWIGRGLERPMRIAVVSQVEVTGGGAWTKVGKATLSGSVTSFLLTKLSPSADSSGSAAACATTEAFAAVPEGPPNKRNLISGVSGNGLDCQRQSRFSDVQGAVEWSVGPVEVAAHGGYRFGDEGEVTPDSRRWAAGTATYWVSSQFAAIVGGGRQPANPARGLPARSYANFGLMLAYWPIPRRTVPVESGAFLSSFEVVDAGYGAQTIIIRAGGVESVEIMGDFTEWEAISLYRIGRDRWEATLPIAPGIHQVNVRVDKGKWKAPPGMPSMRDGFSGEVGILVVE